MSAKASIGRVATLTAICLGSLLAAAGHAQADAITLYIKNDDTQTVKATLRNENTNCYESDQTALGQIWSIAPGDQVRMFFWRVGGHGCNGRQGEFDLQFDPPAGDSSIVHLDYSNDGGIQITPGRANTYPGKLTRGNSAGGENPYTFTTVRLKQLVTAGASVGHWISICENICNYQTVHTVNTTNTSTKTFTKEEKNSITSSLESKLTFKGVGSLTGTLTTEMSKTIGSQMSDQFQRGETISDADNYVFTPEQMRDFKIYAIWQWVADTQLSDGQTITIRSRSFTCTPDATPPQYLPGAPQALKACRGG